MQWMNNIYPYSPYQTNGCGYLPGCFLAIVCARAGLLPPTLSLTALTRLFQVGFPNFSTWEMEREQQTTVMWLLIKEITCRLKGSSPSFQFWPFSCQGSVLGVINVTGKAKYKCGPDPYIVTLSQPYCKHISQAVTGRVGVSWKDSIQFTQADS